MNVWPYGEYFSITDTFETNRVTYRDLQIPKYGALLDWGCYDGRNTNTLTERFGPRRVIGIDIFKNSIKKAKKEYPDLEFHCIDGCDYEKLEELGSLGVIFAMNNLLPGLKNKNITEHDFKSLINRVFKEFLVEDGVIVLSDGNDLCYKNRTGVWMSYEFKEKDWIKTLLE